MNHAHDLVDLTMWAGTIQVALIVLAILILVAVDASIMRRPRP